MSRHRVWFGVALLTGSLWAIACGDGATDPLRPEPSRPTTVTVSPATIQLTALDATAQLTAEVRDQSGEVMSGATVTWASSSAAVATVDGSGLVTAVGNGTTVVTATSGEASGSVYGHSRAEGDGGAGVTRLGDAVRDRGHDTAGGGGARRKRPPGGER